MRCITHYFELRGFTYTYNFYKTPSFQYIKCIIVLVVTSRRIMSSVSIDCTAPSSCYKINVRVLTQEQYESEWECTPLERYITFFFYSIPSNICFSAFQRLCIELKKGCAYKLFATDWKTIFFVPIYNTENYHIFSNNNQIFLWYLQNIRFLFGRIAYMIYERGRWIYLGQMFLLLPEGSGIFFHV